MQLLYALIGGGLVLVVFLDTLWTVFWVDGSAGPLTGRVTTWGWRAALRLSRRRHKALSTFGPVILVTTVVLWIVLLAMGWVLLFAADPSALRDTRDDVLASWTGRIWFVAYTMFTVGNGDFTPQDGLWQVVSSVVAVSGLFLVTLAITYLLSVLSAVTSKRSFAGQVMGLGGSAEELVLSGWNGHDLHSLDRHLADLSSQLARLNNQYLAYPVLQYYHAAAVDRSPVKAVAVLDDALTLMTSGIADAARPDVASLTSARSSVTSFVEDTQQAAALAPAAEVPPWPRLDVLRQHGIPTVDDGAFEGAMSRLDERRKALLGLVQGDGWRWSD